MLPQPKKTCSKDSVAGCVFWHAKGGLSSVPSIYLFPVYSCIVLNYQLPHIINGCFTEIFGQDTTKDAKSIPIKKILRPVDFRTQALRSSDKSEGRPHLAVFLSIQNGSC
mmetsp:Transcript_8639/g.13493  ORF Transcript_8639/g.13493 Transcript_8639/m.13493 type:complete len:110 (-) Transcript_8639:25-354(-)